MTPFQLANDIESGIWISMAVVLAVLRRGHPMSWLILVLFGISDVVEAQTGAWWRPWWLLIWKGGCVGYFVWLGIFAIRRRAVRPLSSPS